MKLYLAPMEGVVDFTMRDIYTDTGGIDQCVTEFIRVTDLLLPNHLFYKYCPELHMNSKTRAGTPVFIQLLGGKPGPMAENAFRAAHLGAAGIDLNFGCPAKTVNRHDGGASLLKDPCRIYDIVKAVRSAVPKHIPVTAKIRLGFDDKSQCIENAKAADEGGAHFLTVHARTKTDGYRPPAYWDWIPRLKEGIKIPVIANGEIWSVSDYQKCREISGCEDVMIGRGAMSDPFLFRNIRAAEAKAAFSTDSWPMVFSIVPKFYNANLENRPPQFAVARTKQWLKSLSLRFEEAKEIFDRLKIIISPEEFHLKIQETFH